jgi:hypothetical protein
MSVAQSVKKGSLFHAPINMVSSFLRAITIPNVVMC